MENNKVTGYNYIDDVVLEIKQKLPKEEQKTFDKLCKNIYRAGITEGMVRSKKENEIK